MLMGLIEKVLEHPIIYSVWQSSHSQKKTAVIRKEIRLGPDQNVLDFGCGPGINATIFPNNEYVGADINPAYTAYAERKYHKRFITVDLCGDFEPEERYDWVLINSFFHHVPDKTVAKLLRSASRALKPSGKVLIIDPIRPSNGFLAKILMRLDRGKFIRPLEEFKKLIDPLFYTRKSYTFQIRILGITLWTLCVFVLEKGNQPRLS